MKSLIYITSLIFLFVACKELPPKQQELKDTINKTLSLKSFHTIHNANGIISFNELRQNYNYLSVVFLQKTCKPCYPKFIEWQQKMDSITAPDNYSVLFVIKGNSYGEFMTNVLDIQYVEDKFYTIIDPEGKFLEMNNDIPSWIIDRSVLIDGENKIKMVGAPFSTPEMTALFHSICNNDRAINIENCV